MATAAQNLDAAIANYTARLAELSAVVKPSYNADGQNVEWNEYQQTLMKLNDLLKVRQDLDGAWIQTQRGIG